MKNLVVPFLILMCFAAFVSAQPTVAVDQKKAEMKKLEKMAGQWKGGGWSQYGPKRETFTGGENVQVKIDGLALLIEGKFANPEGKVIHETLAVMSFDENSKTYSFDAFLATGRSGEYEMKVFPDRYEWGFDVSGGTVRYTIKVDDKTWYEIGEFSRDGGKTWFKNFEMKLDRVK